MRYTGQSSDEPTESYAEYKARYFNTVDTKVQSVVDDIIHSSLHNEDKKSLLAHLKRVSNDRACLEIHYLRFKS